MGKIVSLDAEQLIKDYLQENISIRALAYKYNVSRETIRRRLKDSNNPEVLKKMKEQFVERNVVKNRKPRLEYALQNNIFDDTIKKLCKRVPEIICVIQCLHCGKITAIKEKFYSDKNCVCGKNIIYFGSVNFLNAKVLYKSKNLKNYSLRTFDMWRD